MSSKNLHNDEINDKVLKLINAKRNRSLDISWQQLYNRLYDINLANSTSRRRLRAIKTHLENRDEIDTEDLLNSIKEKKHADISLSWRELYKDFYGKKVSESSARKRLRAVQIHYDYLKLDMFEGDNFGNLNLGNQTNKKENKDNDNKEQQLDDKIDEIRRDTMSVEKNKDGSITKEDIIPVRVDEDKNFNKTKAKRKAEKKLLDEEDLLKKHGYDPEVWKVKKSKHSIWNSQRNEEEHQVIVLFSSSITVDKKEGITQTDFKKVTKDIIENYDRDKIKKYNYDINSNKTPDKKSYMAEISIADLHLGRLGWHEETGENYDLHIASDRFKYVIKQNIKKLKNKNKKIEKILFTIGNDFFDVDNNKKSTNKGTLQDTDVRWPKLFNTGMELINWALEELSQIAPVHTFVVPGNHDNNTSVYLINSVWCYFHNNENITVDKSPKKRKYFRYGNNLIGFMHGKDITKKNKRVVMQNDVKELWGQTNNHEMHTAHFHTEAVKEHGGIVFRQLSTILSNSSYEYKKGWTGNVKKSQTFLWNKEYGVEEIMHIIIPENLIERE